MNELAQRSRRQKPLPSGLLRLLPLRSPIRFHALGLGFTLRNAPAFTFWDHSSCRLGSFRRPARTLRGSLERFDSSVQFVTLCHKQGEDVIDGHRL